MSSAESSDHTIEGLLTLRKRLNEECVLLYIRRLPRRELEGCGGVKAGDLRLHSGLGDRELDITLQRLRRAGKIRYGWHVVNDD